MSPFFKLVFITTILCLVTSNAFCQRDTAMINSLLISTFKAAGKQKKIIKGTRRNGTGYFYSKKTNKLIQVGTRKQYKTRNHEDSMAFIFYGYINDSLVRVDHYMHIYAKNKKPKRNHTVLYFDQDKLISVTKEEDVPDLHIDAILKEAICHLQRAYQIKKGHRYRKEPGCN